MNQKDTNEENAAECRKEAAIHAARREQWYGVWSMRDGYGGHWHGMHDGSSDDVQTTRTEAERICKALNEFAAERTDSVGWSYEVRPYAARGATATK